MARFTKRRSAGRSAPARRSYSPARRSTARRSNGRGSGARRSPAPQVIKIVIQSGPAQGIGDPGSGAVVKKASKSRF